MAIQKTKKIKSKKTSKSLKAKRSYEPILNAKDIPATQGMLDQLHKVIRADVKSLEKKMEARFSQVDARLSQVESGIQLVLSEVHRVALMMEEQNSAGAY